MSVGWLVGWWSKRKGEKQITQSPLKSNQFAEKGWEKSGVGWACGGFSCALECRRTRNPCVCMCVCWSRAPSTFCHAQLKYKYMCTHMQSNYNVMLARFTEAQSKGWNDQRLWRQKYIWHGDMYTGTYDFWENRAYRICICIEYCSYAGFKVFDNMKLKLDDCWLWTVHG